MHLIEDHPQRCAAQLRRRRDMDEPEFRAAYDRGERVCRRCARALGLDPKRIPRAPGRDDDGLGELRKLLRF